MGLRLKSLSITLNGDATNGSLYCRKDGNTAIFPIASTVSTAIDLTGVFVSSALGNTIHIRAELENTSQFEIIATLMAKENADRPLFGDITFPGVMCINNSITVVETDISSHNIKLLNVGVHKFVQELQWSYNDGITTHFLGNSCGAIYVLSDMPKDPWNTRPGIYSQYDVNYIWTSMLDLCCQTVQAYYTKHQQYPIFDRDYISMFTEELNSSFLFHYDTVNGAPFYTVGWEYFKLQKYLDDRRHYKYNTLNCLDCANIVQIECLTCGIEAQTIHMANGNQGFVTTPIMAIGHSDWAVPFQRGGRPGGFGYHAVASLDTQQDQNTRIWDACLKLDAGHYPGLLPNYMPAGEMKQPDYVLGLAFAQTAQATVNVPTTTAYMGRFYRERLVANGQSCQLTNVMYRIKAIDYSDAMRRMRVTDAIDTAAMAQANDVFDKIALLREGTLIEDYGEYRVYELEKAGETIQIEMMIANNEEEANRFLKDKVAMLANPYIESSPIERNAYQIGNTFCGFVHNNVLVTVSNITEHSKVSVVDMVHSITNAL